MTGKNFSEQQDTQGYYAVAAWLSETRPTLSVAEHCLAERLGSLEPSAYNNGGTRATRDYIEGLRHGADS